MKLSDVQTPELILDRQILKRNIERMATHAAQLGVPLRPHLKTPKSVHVAKLLKAAGATGFNVSTLQEAEYFHASGVEDLYDCVPFSPQKAGRAVGLVDAGCKLTLMTDTVEGAEVCAAAIGDCGPSRPVRFTLEIDVDGYRSGISLNGDELERAARALADHPSIHFAGIMSYAGASYGLLPDGARELAAQHCTALTEAVKRLERIGLACEMVSLGSTPAVLHSETLPGVTEARCGIYTFQDLFQAGIGACTIDDVALSVLTTVTARHPEHNRLVIDAGALALSKDRSTAGKSFEAQYGWVCDATSGQRISDLWVGTVSQELGLVTSASGAPIDFDRFHVGSQLRVLPNHADMTAAAYEAYHVTDGGMEIVDVWSRTNRWSA